MIWIFITTILTGAGGGILMKMGARHLSASDIGSIGGVIAFTLNILTTPALLAGISLYFFSAFLWAFLLTKYDISFVQPILAATYVVTPIAAIFLLQERISLFRWIGIITIVVGVIIVARAQP